jgi:hypothetical protein
MYNERIGQTDGMRRRDTAYPNGRSVRSHHSGLSDIPTSALLRTNSQLANDTESRRNCDGTLKSSDNGTPELRNWGLNDHPLAMVYSPYQIWRNAYAPDVALKRGTLFAELDLPFEGAGEGGC